MTPARVLNRVDLVVGLRRDTARPAPGEIVLDPRKPPRSADQATFMRRLAFARPFFKAVAGRWIARFEQYERIQTAADPTLGGKKAAIRTRSKAILRHIVEVNTAVGRYRPPMRWMHDPSRDIWHTLDPQALDRLHRAVQDHH